MDTNIVLAQFTGRSTAVTVRSLYQWDYGMILTFAGLDLPQAYTVHFANSATGGQAVQMVGGADGVAIPDALLKTGLPVYAFVFLHSGEDDGETVYTVMIPVIKRPEPTDIEPTPEQQSVIDQTIAALNEAVDDAEAARDAIEDMEVSASTLTAGSTATVTKSVDPETGAVTLAFGIPRGDTGAQGQTGQTGETGAPGRDGISPTVETSSITGGHRVTITDSTAHTFDVMDGEDGTDGISPTVSVTEITGGHQVTITDSTAHSFDVMDGVDGQAGQDGSDGADGVTFTPSVSEQGVISWTNDGGRTNPSSVNIKGPQGETGPAGQDGKDGKDGQDGSDGQDGYSPIASVSKSGTTATITITDKLGTTTASISDGQNGTNGQDGAPGVGVPTGGTQGQVLAKTSGTDYATEWVTPYSGTTVENVSGSTLSITGVADHRYICGEVSTLTITTPSSGIVDVIFKSGSTPTVLTVTPPSGMTMAWANGFDPTSLDANTTYEINVMDGCLGVAGTWS